MLLAASLHLQLLVRAGGCVPHGRHQHQPPTASPCPPCCCSHPQVLLGVGPSHSYEALKRRRYYFVFDLLSPWAALTAAPGARLPPVAAAAAAAAVVCLADRQAGRPAAAQT